MNGGLGGDPKINRAAGKRKRDAPVLRCPGFCDVHAGHDLESHHHRRPVLFVQRANLLQYAIDAIANPQEVLLRLEVDIGCRALDRVSQQGIDQANNRLAVAEGFRTGAEALVIDLARLYFVQDAVNR